MVNLETAPIQQRPNARRALTAGLLAQLRPAIVGAFVLSLLAGAIFPLALYAVAQTAFPDQANGSLLSDKGVVVGSHWIGQIFTLPEYFHGRPSAAGAGYDATASGASSLAPDNPKFIAAVRERAAAYRQENGLAASAPIPIDAVTASASGLDPHISPMNADLQVARVARARGWGETAVRALVSAHTQGRVLGFLGEPRVSVLELNLALDQAARTGGI